MAATLSDHVVDELAAAGGIVGCESLCIRCLKHSQASAEESMAATRKAVDKLCDHGLARHIGSDVCLTDDGWTSANAKRPVLVVDATGAVVRQFCSPGDMSPAAALVAVIAGFTKRHPCDVEIVFDGGGETFRHRIFPGYKASRPPKEKSLLDCLADAKALSVDYGRVHCILGVEADDVIATLVRRHSARGRKAIVFSSDKDFWALLVPDRVTVLQSARRDRGEWRYSYFTAAMFRDKFGIDPHQWPEVRAMSGDASDEWRGAAGVGEATAVKLVQAFGTIDKVMDAIRDWPHSLELLRGGVKLSKRQVDGLRALDIGVARTVTYLKADVEIQEDRVHGRT